MVFTKEEILLESNYISDFYRISTASDLMIESFADGEYTTESENNIINTLKSAVSTMIKKVKDLIIKYYNELTIKIAKVKYKDLLNEKSTKYINDAKNGKITGPDIKKAVKICNEYEKFCDKFIAELDKQLTNYMLNPTDAMSEKVNKLIDSGNKKISEFTDRADKALSTDITYTVSDAIASLKYTESINKKPDLFTSMLDKISDKEDMIEKKLREIGNFEAKNGLNQKDDIAVVKQAKNIKGILLKSIDCIHNFLNEHSKITKPTIRALYMISAGVEGLFTSQAALNTSSTVIRGVTNPKALKNTMKNPIYRNDFMKSVAKDYGKLAAAHTVKKGIGKLYSSID